ncbi:MAG: hypothetical protein ABI333_05060 [bacterium]
MLGRTTRLALLFAAGAALGWPLTAAAEGPGSGDEVVNKQLNPKMLRRIWKYSRARRAQERRIKELKNKLEALRTVLPKLQADGMAEADRQRRYSQTYRAKKVAFQSQWNKIVRLFGKSPLSLHHDVYNGFGITRIWSADTDDWQKCLSRVNQADGDDFFLYANFWVPRNLVGKEYYAIDWRISGYDFMGRERTFYYHTNWSWSRGYQRFRFASTRFRRRITGLGLSPGWYEVRATLKVKNKNWLRREYYATVQVSRVSPMVSAPPAGTWRSKDEAKVKITRLRVRSRGVKRGELNPKKFMIQGTYQVDKSFIVPDGQLLVGGDVYRTGADGKVGYRAIPLRTAFRYRQKLKRATGRFGGKDTTELKGLDSGLLPGKYVLRVWILVTTPRYRQYHAWEDKPFEVVQAPPTRGRN